MGAQLLFIRVAPQSVTLLSVPSVEFQQESRLTDGKCTQLVIALRAGKHVGGIAWTVVPLYVEVGRRGAINEEPWYGTCRKLGFTKTITRRVT